MIFVVSCLHEFYVIALVYTNIINNNNNNNVSIYKSNYIKFV